MYTCTVNIHSSCLLSSLHNSAVLLIVPLRDGGRGEGGGRGADTNLDWLINLVKSFFTYSRAVDDR